MMLFVYLFRASYIFRPHWRCSSYSAWAAGRIRLWRRFSRAY